MAGQPQSHLQDVIKIKPELNANPPNPVPNDADNATAEPTVIQQAAASEPDSETNESTNGEYTYTQTLKNNASINFFIKVKDKEYGPLKFLILLSLLKQNKLSPDAKTRSEHEQNWGKLSDYLPKEFQQTIQITPIFSPSVLPKNLWKRKNVRLDYEEMVLVSNSRYSLVGKSIDLSAEGIAVIWVYDVPINELFDLSLFDLEKNLITVPGRLARVEPIKNDQGSTFYKAVFLFKEKIQIKNFIPA